MLTCDKFCDLPEGRKQFLLDPLKMFDMIGWMVSTGAVRLKSVINYFGADVIIRSWDLYRPFVEDARKHVGHYLFLYYENLAQQVIGWNKTPVGRFRSKSRQETSWDGCPTRLRKSQFPNQERLL
jgi:hypothetical protein